MTRKEAFALELQEKISEHIFEKLDEMLGDNQFEWSWEDEYDYMTAEENFTKKIADIVSRHIEF